jgi:RNA polymerase sigma factor (sigma-70 family)
MTLATRLWDEFVVFTREQNQQLKRVRVSENARKAIKIRWSAHTCTPKPQQNHTVLLSEVRAKAGAKAMWNRWHREREIFEQLPVVDRIAGEVAHMFARHIPHEDLVQTGRVGLVQAANKYEPGRGAFAPYAWFRIRGAIIDAHRRVAYREEQHDSTDELSERLGAAGECRSNEPLPDALAIESERGRLLARAIAGLEPDERWSITQALAGVSLGRMAAERGHSASWWRGKLDNARRRVSAEVRGVAYAE